MKKEEALNIYNDATKHYYLDKKEVVIRARDLDKVLRQYVDEETSWFKRLFR